MNNPSDISPEPLPQTCPQSGQALIHHPRFIFCMCNQHLDTESIFSERLRPTVTYRSQSNLNTPWHSSHKWLHTAAVAPPFVFSSKTPLCCWTWGSDWGTDSISTSSCQQRNLLLWGPCLNGGALKRLDHRTVCHASQPLPLSTKFPWKSEQTFFCVATLQNPNTGPWFTIAHPPGNNCSPVQPDTLPFI